jgi:hypothetical protein
LWFLATSVQAQFISPNVGSKYNGFNSDTQNGGPTNTPTWDPMMPTYTPTPSPTYNAFSTDTWTATPGSPTDTATYTFTATQTGTIYTPTPTWSATPNISRASLVMLPTAYSNATDHWDGFNWDMDFTYFIGSIVSEDYNQQNISSQFDSLEQINIVMLTTDVKYAWLDDRGNLPGIASGMMLSLFAQVGSGNSTATASSSQAFEVSNNEIGGIYTVMSKTVAKDTAVHFGYMYGLRSLSSNTFSMDYPALLPFLAPGLSNYVVAQAGSTITSTATNPPDLFYVGFNTRFLGRNWKFEIWKPDPFGLNPYSYVNSATNVNQIVHPILFNTLIDGLPMAFNLGYERWGNEANGQKGGFAVLGYVNFRIPLLPANAPY